MVLIIKYAADIKRRGTDMTADEQRRIEETTQNKIALIGWSVEIGIIIVAYVMEVVKKARSVPYLLAVLACGLIPLVIAWVFYKNRPTDGKIRYLACIGFTILYAFVLISGATLLTCVYCFPLLQVLVIYNDPKMLLVYAITNILANIVSVVVKIVSFEMSFEEYGASYEIEVLGVTLVLILAFVTTKAMRRLNDMKVGMIVEHQKQTETILETVTEATRELNEKVAAIDSEARQIEGQSTEAQNAVEEIAAGTSEVANTISEQMEMSNGISQDLEELNKVSEEINSKFENTVKLTNEGLSFVSSLSKSTEVVSESKNQVSSATEALLESIKQAKEILSLINNITSQTNLLSLNASIEAARAGEAGRGFAVVAGEIQNLSQNTAQATDQISTILEELSTQANKVNRAVEGLEEVSDRQTKLINDTDGNFNSISENVGSIKADFRQQLEFLTEINTNNKKIASSIFNTSAFTEELTSGAENTRNITRESLEGTKNMTLAIADAYEQVKKLSSVTNG